MRSTTVKEIQREFEEAFHNQNYGDAYDCILRYLDHAPGSAGRYLIGGHSSALAQILTSLGKVDEIAAQLEQLLPSYPTMHALCGNEPAEIERIVRLREANIDKGLPSALLVTQGKSGSVSVGSIFNSGFNLPSFAYSLGTLRVLPGWLRDYKRGGACHVTHLIPSVENIALLKQGGIDRIIVHVRDPRQIFVSMAHHVIRYADQTPMHNHAEFKRLPFTRQIDALLPYYYQSVYWIAEWVQAASLLAIHFSDFAEFVTDKHRFIDKYLAFYGGDRRHFNQEVAMQQQPGTDYHYRSGKVDEWKQVLTPEQIERLTAAIPRSLIERFGWEQ